MKRMRLRHSRIFSLSALAGFELWLVLLLAGAAWGGVFTDWVQRYDGPGNYQDTPYAVTVDSAGNVYVTGSSWGDGSGYDYATIKYGPDGDVLWERRYNGPGNSFDAAYAIAVDRDGNVYVTGGSKGGMLEIDDYATIKYSPGGDVLWVRRYNGPGSHNDLARAIAVDRDGNVYVTGSSAGDGTGSDYATIKYNSAGDRLWVRRYNGPGNGEDVARGMIVDTLGNIYVTGYSAGDGTGHDYATIKYNSDGDRLWVRRYNGPGNDRDEATAIGRDKVGNIYVTGFSYGDGTGGDYFTMKYNPAGTRLWARRYNGPGNGYDEARAISVDDQGVAYVTGFSTGDGSGYDYATIKYNPDGGRAWVRRYNGPVNDADHANAITLDSGRNIYVTGESMGAGTGTDFATIKYSFDGDLLWARRYHGPAYTWSSAKAIKVDSLYNVYVAGSSRNAEGNDDYATIKYGQTP